MSNRLSDGLGEIAATLNCISHEPLCFAVNAECGGSKEAKPRKPEQKLSQMSERIRIGQRMEERMNKKLKLRTDEMCAV